MPRLTYTSWVDASLDDVWAFHQEVEANLPQLSPPAEGVRISSIEGKGLGAIVRLSVKTPYGRKPWEAVYSEFQPPHGSRPHRSAWFVDEQTTGPFKRWTHRHWFVEGVHEGRVKTRVIDDVHYEAPFGPLGVLAGPVVIRPKLKKIFKYRQRKLAELLGQPRAEMPDGAR